MGGALALLFPVNFFYGTLIGLQRQVLSNAIIVAATAFRGALTIAALYGFGSSPAIFFFAQLISSAVEAAVLACVVWKLVPSSPQGMGFDSGLLRTTWKFTSGTWLAVLFAQIATLGDKIVLSTLLPLHLFGLYSLAVTVTSTIQRLAPPFTNTYFPYFVRLLEQDRQDSLLNAYRQASEFASAVFLAAGLSLLLYAGTIARLLAANADDAANLAWLLALLAAANTLGALMALPFALQFAHGVTWVALRINFALSVLYLAALVLLVPALRDECRRGAMACRQCADVSRSHRHDPSGDTARAGVAMARAHGTAAGLRRGGCSRGRRRYHAGIAKRVDDRLDWLQRRDCSRCRPVVRTIDAAHHPGAASTAA